MGYFPFFIDIKGKKGLVIGGGRIAEHKISKLLAYEPELTVVARKVSDSILKALILLKENLLIQIWTDVHSV